MDVFSSLHLTMGVRMIKKFGIFSVLVVMSVYLLGLLSVKEIYTEIVIEAPASVVWNHLVDFKSYPSWNPFVRRIDGIATEGESLKIVVQPLNENPMIFEPVLLTVDKDAEMKWLGRLLMPGIFDGEHSFELMRLSATRVKFVQKESFRGFLAFLLWDTVEPGTKKGFRAMNRSLKHISESSVSNRDV
jgi:hypothetical protein